MQLSGSSPAYAYELNGQPFADGWVTTYSVIPDQDMNPMVVALSVRRPDGPPAPLTAGLLRKIPFSTDLITVRAQLANQHDWYAAFDHHDLTDEALSADRVARPRSAGRQRDRDRKLALIAEAYAAAYAENPGGGARSLYRTMSATLANAGVLRRDGGNYSQRTLAESVTKARVRGFLTPTIRGRAGGVLTPNGYAALDRPLGDKALRQWLREHAPETLGKPVRDQRIIWNVIVKAASAKRRSDRRPRS